jgi:tyrosine-protein kinase
LNLTEFFVAVRRYRWTAVVVAGAVLAIGLAGILVSPSKYVSTTQLMVSIEGSTTANAYENDEVVAGRVNSYIALLSSGVVVQRVIDKLGLPLTASELASEINATNVPPRTAIIDVSVTDQSPARAQLLASTLATEFISYTKALETPTGEDGQKVHTRVVTDASEPRERRAELVFLGLLAAVAAMLTAAVAVWVRSRTDPVIRSADQAADATGVPVIGSVTDRSATAADDLEGYCRLWAGLRSIMNPTKESARGRVVMVTSAAGEVDAESVASNLGRAMELSGRRSIVLDVRFPQSDAAEDESNSADETNTGATDIADTDSASCVDICDQTSESPQPERRVEGFPDTLPLSGWAAEPHQLGTKIVTELIDELRSLYDTTVVAGPSVLGTAAASIVAEYADAVVVAVSAGESRRRDVAGAAADLRATGAPLIGTILWQRPHSVSAQRGAIRGRQRFHHLGVGTLGSLSLAGAVGVFAYQQIYERLSTP